MEKKRLEKPTHIGIYWRYRAENKVHEYEFSLGTKEMLEEQPVIATAATFGQGSKLKLIAVMKVHPMHLNEMNRFMSSALHYEPPFFGHINYKVKGTTAKSPNYSPKKRLLEALRLGNDRTAPGLGFLLEEFCTRHLKTRGITHIFSDPQSKRIGQLKSVGLPMRAEVPVDLWIAGMRQGFLRRIQEWKARKKVAEG